VRKTLELTVAELDCADEAQQIEGALRHLDGVSEVRTTVSARRAMVAYDADRVTPEAIRETLHRLGMTVTDTRASLARGRRSLGNLLGWGFVSVVALAVLVGIAGERLGLVERLVERIPPWLALAAVLAGGYPIFLHVGRALRNRTVTSHALMTLGIVGAIAIGQYAAAAVIVFFLRLADFIEGYTTERSRQAIKELLKLAPETARIERAGREVVLPADQVGRWEIVVVKPGERIPVDGSVLEGRASVNQAPITGESVPVEKQAGAQVFAATICERGALRVRTERVGRDTTFGQIIRLVEEAEASKAPVQRFADRFTAYYIPVVLAAAVTTYVVGGSATAAVATVLVACSCAIAMATPITVLAAVARSARQGIIIKGGRYLEALAKVDTVVMDKTGTLTLGRPEITDLIPLDGASETSLLTLAAVIERRSEHPLAAGIVRAAAARGLVLGEPKDFEVYPGEGVTATVDGVSALCGTERLMARFGVAVPEPVLARVRGLAEEGRSVVVVARAGRAIGLIALGDTIRPEVQSAIAALRALGVRRLLLLTGDRHEVAAAVARPARRRFRGRGAPRAEDPRGRAAPA
jgi:P-type Cu+ transporter